MVYVIWLFATSIELILLGNFGQKYTDSAEKLGDMYYMCGWEHLLDTESPKDNREIINLLEVAIFRCQKPVHITGLKFVVLSKANVMNVGRFYMFAYFTYNILSGFENFDVLLHVSKDYGRCWQQAVLILFVYFKCYR